MATCPWMLCNQRHAASTTGEVRVSADIDWKTRQAATSLDRLRVWSADPSLSDITQHEVQQGASHVPGDSGWSPPEVALVMQSAWRMAVAKAGNSTLRPNASAFDSLRTLAMSACRLGGVRLKRTAPMSLRGG